MKKFLVTFLSLFISLLVVAPNFFSYAKLDNVSFAASNFSEEDLSNVCDIVPTQKSEMKSSLSIYAKEGETPFDTSTSSPMSGASIEPTYGSYGQVSASYAVNEFSLSSNLSIFMWIFFPDSHFYDLTIKFTSSDGSYVSWVLNWVEVSDLIYEGGAYVEQYGWKLFEFSLSDADEISSSSIYSATFSSMYISYNLEEELDIFKKTSSNTFAFYHVYTANKYSSQTSVVKVQKYAYYSISEDFTSKFSNLLVDDTMTFGVFESMFSYIYVAKFDLKNKTNTYYTWSGTITPSGSESQEIYSGETVTFDSSGWCSLKITLSEYRSDGSEIVIFYSNSVYVNKLTLGSFVENTYEITQGEKLTINFKISNFFVVDGDIDVSVSDKSIASVTYYVSNNICYITVVGEAEGETILTVSANGGKEGGEISSYSKSVTIEVEKKTSNSFTKIFLWSTVIVYLIGIVIYVIITIVRAKKDNVR